MGENTYLEKINALGDVCPVPVIKAKNAMKDKAVNDGIIIEVDNVTSVENLSKLASEYGYEYRLNKISDADYEVTLLKLKQDEAKEGKSGGNTVVVISSNKMGEGNDELGGVLIKGFIYALTELDSPPETILFYNGGALLTTEGSKSLDDIKALEQKGTEVLTCGTCLNYYNVSDKLAAGGVTNMYTIVEKLNGASNIIKP